ncbi:hypothetical protein E2C01_080702 [Portunus trituberculatus]|uniref:Uncharacterized protein n=1 Tax=Portunus trituberculatus TaxID=210409 RepID=A0A5B7IU40_PORTR|nr:hypothetical protein [Portunus trituberculatus]
MSLRCLRDSFPHFLIHVLPCRSPPLFIFQSLSSDVAFCQYGCSLHLCFIDCTAATGTDSYVLVEPLPCCSNSVMVKTFQPSYLAAKPPRALPNTFKIAREGCLIPPSRPKRALVKAIPLLLHSPACHSRKHQSLWAGNSDLRHGTTTRRRISLTDLVVLHLSLLRDIQFNPFSIEMHFYHEF